MLKSDHLRLMIINLFLIVLVAIGVGFAYWQEYWLVPAIIVALIAYIASSYANQAMIWKAELKKLKEELKK